MKFLCAFAVLFVAPAFLSHTDATPPPPAGIVTDAIVVSVYDGDTLTVRPMMPEVSIRLRDCWAPEIRGVPKPTKIKGFQSRDNLRELLPVGSTARVRIKVTGRLKDSLTFGRVLGDVWTTGGIDVAERQVETGHATKQKQPR